VANFCGDRKEASTWKPRITLKPITKSYNDKLDALERAKQWVKGVEEAAARPENAAIVAEIRKASKDDATFRRSWAKIQGAPLPKSSDSQTVENNADKANGASVV